MVTPLLEYPPVAHRATEKGDAEGTDDKDHGAGQKRSAKTPDEGLAGCVGEPLALSAPELPGDSQRGGQRLLRPSDHLTRHAARRLRKARAVARVEHAP